MYTTDCIHRLDYFTCHAILIFHFQVLFVFFSIGLWYQVWGVFWENNDFQGSLSNRHFDITMLLAALKAMLAVFRWCFGWCVRYLEEDERMAPLVLSRSSLSRWLRNRSNNENSHLFWGIAADSCYILLPLRIILCLSLSSWMTSGDLHFTMCSQGQFRQLGLLGWLQSCDVGYMILYR